MIYPLISEYTEAILSAEDNFNELAHLRPVLDEHGHPIMSSGNFAVVYKMEDPNTGKHYAVKCFTRDQKNRNKRYKNICSQLSNEESEYLTSFTFHESELFVDSTQTNETEFPILLMDWVEGKPLDKFIEEYSGNPFVLYELCYNFRQLAKWLVSKSFAHGDLKPDNILVREDVSIVVIDYDGMYVWSREIQEAPEGGTPEYRNPYYQTPFDEHMDDFSLAVISLSLKLISISYNVQNKFVKGNGLLFSKEDLINRQNSAIFKHLESLLQTEPLLGLYYATFIKCLSGNKLTLIDFDFKDEEELNCLLNFFGENVHIFHETRLKKGRLADNGLIYSQDGTMVIGFDNDNYDGEIIQIEEGTIAICENAFEYSTPKLKLKFPSTLRYFSPRSLHYRYSELSWDSPWFTYEKGCIYTVDKTECILQHLEDAEIDDKTKIFGMCLFADISFNINWPSKLKRIRKDAFNHSNVYNYFDIPEGLIEIGYRAFQSSNIKKVYFPSTLVSLGASSFHYCSELESVEFKKDCGIDKIKSHTFCNCKNLQKISFPNKLKHIEDSSFLWCGEILELKFPNSLVSIGERAFEKDVKTIWGDGEEIIEFQPSVISKIELPASLNVIGKRAFANSTNLKEIVFKSDTHNIEELAFSNCPLNIEITELIGELTPGAITGSTIISCESSKYFIENNCLYKRLNNDHFELIYYWGNHKVLELKEGTQDFYESACKAVPNVLILPDSFIAEHLFINNSVWIEESNYIRIIAVPNSYDIDYIKKKTSRDVVYKNDYFIDEPGVLYSKDKITLCDFPYYLVNKSYKILNGCEIIGERAFDYYGDVFVDEDGADYFEEFNNIEKIIFPSSLKKIEQDAFIGCKNLKEIYVPNGMIPYFEKLIDDADYKLIEYSPNDINT